MLSLANGLNEQVIRKISADKKEPAWMLNVRLKAYAAYKKMPMPKFGPDIKIDLDSICYYAPASNKAVDNWNELPKDIKETYDKIGLPEAEKRYFGWRRCAIQLIDRLSKPKKRVGGFRCYFSRYRYRLKTIS